MKIIENIDLITKNYGSVSTLMGEPRIHVRDRPISKLITLLEKQGVNISREDSNKTIELGERNNITVLLNTTVTKSTPKGYCLKGDAGDFTDIQIEFEDYYNKYGEQPGVIGGSFHVEHGIKGEIIFEGTYEQGVIIPMIKEIVERFYSPLSPLQKKLKNLQKKINY